MYYKKVFGSTSILQQEAQWLVRHRKATGSGRTAPALRPSGLTGSRSRCLSIHHRATRNTFATRRNKEEEKVKRRPQPPLD
jgi:hypothetical protein